MPVTLSPLPQPKITIAPQGTGAVTLQSPSTTTIVVRSVGVQGPPGPAAITGQRFEQIAAASTWVFSHAIGRLPVVEIYFFTGERVFADVTASNSTVSVVFAEPQAGFVILN